MMDADPEENFFLSQREETIFINKHNIPQHHTEGIRFLFRQYKRKRPGVIINDPYGYGRNIQTILFLNATRRFLSKPILIICEEGNEFEWVERFDTWTDMYHEVGIETHHPNSRKMIMINPMINLPNFCKHDWSVLIIDGQNDKAVYQILKLPFKADFKIWNTPHNMKENLDVFGEVYHWLYPNEVFDKPYFIPEPDNVLDACEKTILLDSFMEDIVLRRDDLSKSFEKYKNTMAMPPPQAPPPSLPPVPTKKNKDATGTKIKRSKARQPEPPKENTQPHVTPHTVVKEQPGGSTSTGIYRDINDDYSIQNFKRHDDTDFLNSEIESQFKTIDINPSENSELKLYYESDPIPPNVDAINNRAFGSYAFNSSSSMLNRKRVSNLPFTYSEDNLSESDDEVFIHKQKSADTYNAFVLEGTSSHSKSSTADDPIASEIPLPNDDEPFLDNKSMTAECDSLSLIPNNESMNLNLSVNPLGDDQPEVSRVNDNDKGNQSIVGSVQVSGAMNTKQVTNNLKRNNIDDKIKECEAKVAKKFKGSFLDSLF
ncbi:unnamed protein product [Chrysodeixis includens]|uniref:Uncharacterized protein n=1 Tax=Chrysodeixis includens TaxID=689277 RepID=A0A9P0FSY0_CHRIL|nr:unnamed protein product [Chrysodeixis includens]